MLFLTALAYGIILKRKHVLAAIKELEKIEMIWQTDGEYRMDHAVTAAQKTILNAFKIDAAYVQIEAGRRICVKNKSCI